MKINSISENPSKSLGMIGLNQLIEANCAVIAELTKHGFYDEHLQAVETYLVPVGGDAYGWQMYGTSGEIMIPCVSLQRLRDQWEDVQRFTSRRAPVEAKA